MLERFFLNLAEGSNFLRMCSGTCYEVNIVPYSAEDYTHFVSFVCLSVSHFSQPCFNTETIHLVSYGIAHH